MIVSAGDKLVCITEYQLSRLEVGDEIRVIEVVDNSRIVDSQAKVEHISKRTGHKKIESWFMLDLYFKRVETPATPEEIAMAEPIRSYDDLESFLRLKL